MTQGCAVAMCCETSMQLPCYHAAKHRAGESGASPHLLMPLSTPLSKTSRGLSGALPTTSAKMGLLQAGATQEIMRPQEKKQML